MFILNITALHHSISVWSSLLSRVLLKRADRKKKKKQSDSPSNKVDGYILSAGPLYLHSGDSSTFRKSWTSSCSQLVLSSLWSIPPMLTGAPDWRGGGNSWLRLSAAGSGYQQLAQAISSWLRLSAAQWEADPVARLESGRILTLLSGSLQSLDRLCAVSQHWVKPKACYWLNLGYRTVGISALPLPTVGVWPE